MTEPAWLTAARAKLGTREAPGALNNPTILGWAKKLGVKVLGMVYNADSVPWCGLFVAECMTEASVPTPSIAVRATSWATWGSPAPLGNLAPGVVLVFARPGGGHVSFYVGEDATCYHVLGGNQGDCVDITRIEKTRCIAARWPLGVPYVGHVVRMTARPGQPISTNEA